MIHPQEDRLLVLDLGPADITGAKLKSINPKTTMAELEGMLL